MTDDQRGVIRNDTIRRLLLVSQSDKRLTEVMECLSWEAISEITIVLDVMERRRPA